MRGGRRKKKFCFHHIVNKHKVTIRLQEQFYFHNKVLQYKPHFVVYESCEVKYERDVDELFDTQYDFCCGVQKLWLSDIEHYKLIIGNKWDFVVQFIAYSFRLYS